MGLFNDDETLLINQKWVDTGRFIREHEASEFRSLKLCISCNAGCAAVITILTCRLRHKYAPTHYVSFQSFRIKKK